MQADGLEWGEDYRPLGRQMLACIMEEKMTAGGRLLSRPARKTHAIVPQLFLLFLLGTPIESCMPLFNETEGAAGSFVSFGFRISRLPRFCPLAISPFYPAS
jgi:hypothetical protein